ncbi:MULTISPECIES: aspartate aminotransferase family protein [unclassified Acinetobacter]|uniref:aspartate aminotransferase family protein n=1 Tax=unclassified Acinetobacter TaxID=196816 RepID=UPI0035B7965F
MTANTVTRQHFNQYFVPVYDPAQFIPDHGKGSRLWDTTGREYVDFAGGIAVSALGHAHPAMVEALKNQAEKLWHLSNAYTNEQVIKLAKKLVDNTFADLVFFANSGAEANEAALKLARKVGSSINPSKTEIISFTKSFHGRTLFTVSAGGQPKYSAAFAPLPAGIHHATYNDIESVKALINDNTCGVIIEPIQGEGGIIPACPEFLKQLRELCDKHNAALIFDEVQSGMGRTGKLYEYMNTGVTPDILTTAKSLGGGFPIGAMLANEKYGKQLVVGDHGTTYGGNPLACAVANAVFDIVNDEKLLAGVIERHEHFVKKINELNATYPIFQEIRGKGMLIGCALKPEYAGRSKEIVNLAAAEGLMCLVAGPDVIRFAPSLIIEFADIDEGMNRLAKALANFK